MWYKVDRVNSIASRYAFALGLYFIGAFMAVAGTALIIQNLVRMRVNGFSVLGLLVPLSIMVVSALCFGLAVGFHKKTNKHDKIMQCANDWSSNYGYRAVFQRTGTKGELRLSSDEQLQGHSLLKTDDGYAILYSQKNNEFLTMRDSDAHSYRLGAAIGLYVGGSLLYTTACAVFIYAMTSEGTDKFLIIGEILLASFLTLALAAYLQGIRRELVKIDTENQPTAVSRSAGHNKQVHSNNDSSETRSNSGATELVVSNTCDEVYIVGLQLRENQLKGLAELTRTH